MYKRRLQDKVDHHQLRIPDRRDVTHEDRLRGFQKRYAVPQRNNQSRRVNLSALRYQARQDPAVRRSGRGKSAADCEVTEVEQQVAIGKLESGLHPSLGLMAKKNYKESMKRKRLVLYCVLSAVCFTTFVLYSQQVQRDNDISNDWFEPVDLPPSSDEDLAVHREDKQKEKLLDFPPLPTIYEIDFPDLKIPDVLRTAKYSNLASKLHAFLTRPILTHQQAAERNERDCPLRVSDLLVNPDQLNGDGRFWREEVGVDMIAEKRVDLVNWLAEKAAEGEQIVGDARVGRGKRGIVVTGGNQVRDGA